MSTPVLPYITPELIQYLDKLYPDVFPSNSLSDRDLWIKAGQVNVVRHLKKVHHEQVLASLGGDITNVFRR